MSRKTNNKRKANPKDSNNLDHVQLQALKGKQIYNDAYKEDVPKLVSKNPRTWIVPRKKRKE